MTTVDQPLPTEKPAANEALLQDAANALSSALRVSIQKVGGIDMVENEITSKMMFFHVHALSNLLVEKGLIDESSMQAAIAKVFAEQAALLSGPKIVISQGRKTR